MVDPNAHALIVVKEGRTFLHAVALFNPPVRIVKMRREELRQLRPLLYHGKSYPLARAVRRFREAGRALGITKSAAAILRAIDKARKEEQS
jgi:hypothetical protein